MLVILAATFTNALMDTNRNRRQFVNIHKQAIEKKFLEVEFERQAVRTNPTISALRLCLHRRSNIYLHKLPFTVDLTDIKSWIVFKFR